MSFPTRNSNLLKNNDLNILNVDENEFNQREKILDEIKDTLNRYTKEFTFHEFITNANDCDFAFTINFLFDDTTCNIKRLLTTNLKNLQEFVLLIYNDDNKQTLLMLN